MEKPYAFADGHRVNMPSMLLLAGSSRTLSTVWQSPSVGIDHVTWEGQSATVIVLPGKLLLLLLGLLMLTGGGFMWRRSVRRHASARHSRKPVQA